MSRPTRTAIPPRSYSPPAQSGSVRAAMRKSQLNGYYNAAEGRFCEQSMKFSALPDKICAPGVLPPAPNGRRRLLWQSGPCPSGDSARRSASRRENGRSCGPAVFCVFLRGRRLWTGSHSQSFQTSGQKPTVAFLPLRTMGVRMLSGYSSRRSKRSASEAR